MENIVGMRGEFARKREEKGELPVVPSLSFGIELSDEQNQPFQADLERSKAQLEPAWKAVEVPVLTAFEEVTHGRWRRDHRDTGIHVLLRAHGGSNAGYPMMLDIREQSVPYALQRGLVGTIRDTTPLMGTLTHELAHYFQSRDDIDYVEDNFAGRIDRTALRRNTPDVILSICTEIQAEVVWKAVVDRCFPKEVVDDFVERRRGAHKGVYEVIDTLSDDERNRIIDRNRRIFAPVAPKRFFKDVSRGARSLLPPYTNKGRQ